MKKITKSHGEYFNFCKLYQDDILGIIEILKEVSSNIEIIINDLLLDSINEIGKIEQYKITNLKINCKKPYISLSYSNEDSRIYFYISEDNIISRGIFEKIKTILKTKKRKFLFFLINPILSNIIFFISLLIILIQDKFFKNNDLYYKISIILFFVLIIIYNIYCWIKFIKGSSIIYIKKKIEMPTFIKRQKDNIISNIIFLIIGAFLTLLVQFIFK